jgi:hypothetical protein
MAVYRPEAHPYFRCGLQENAEIVKSARYPCLPQLLIPFQREIV